MKKSRFTEEPMVAILRMADKTTVPAVARKHKVSEQTIYTREKRFFALEPADVRRPCAGSKSRMPNSRRLSLSPI